MAHNINEGRMMYVGEKPWHGIGTELKNPATAVEAIQAARLNYEVVLEYVKTESGILIADKRATVRTDTKQPLGVVGTDYKIVQNAKAFSFFDTVVGDGQAIYHTAGALGQGERIWILAKLPKDMVIMREDIVEKYLVLTNSHDGRSSLRVYFTPVRVVCQNTLTISLMDAKSGIAIRHSGDVMNKVDEARRILGISVNFYAQFEKIAEQFADTKLNSKQAEAYFDGLVYEGDAKKAESTRWQNQRNDLLMLFENGKGNQIDGIKHSVWAAYNAVTEYVDHHKTVRGTTEDATNRLKSIWFGYGADVKNRAYESALVYAGVKKG